MVILVFALLQLILNICEGYVHIKSIVQPFELEVETRLIDPLLKLQVWQFFKKFFNGTISREEHKTL